MAVAKAANNVKNDVQDEQDDARISTAEIEEQLSRLREDVSGLVAALSAFGEQKAGDYRRKVGNLAEEAGEASRNAVSGAKSELAAWEAELEESIRRKPLHAVGIAAGIGFVAALLTRR